MWFKNGLKAQKLQKQHALKGQKLYVLPGVFKAFALTGRQYCAHNTPGRCPGLGASALSGRVELTCESLVYKKCGHSMDALFFLGVVTVLFGIVFAVLLSPKGQKWMNEY